MRKGIKLIKKEAEHDLVSRKFGQLGPIESEATALPTEPQPLPFECSLYWHHLFLNATYFHNPNFYERHFEMGDSNFSGKNKVLNAKTILHDHQQQEEKEEEQFL